MMDQDAVEPREDAGQKQLDAQEGGHESIKTEPSEQDTDNSSIPCTISEPKKELKSLLKKTSDDSTRTKKRVTFSETMMVFCDDWPDSLMPQLITLKSPTDFNYMFEPPIEYRDILAFDPPPDYRDLMNASMSLYDNDLSIHYIDDDDDNDQAMAEKLTFYHRHPVDGSDVDSNTAKWENMILNDNEVIEEEQIIGVLKEDAILQAIGSHIILPEEQLCPDDFPIHFQSEEQLKRNKCKLNDEELSDMTSEDGEELSSPNGSLQDVTSDSSITSQDTIILMTNDSGSNYMVSAPLMIDKTSATTTVSFSSEGQPVIANNNAADELQSKTDKSNDQISLRYDQLNSISEKSSAGGKNNGDKENDETTAEMTGRKDVADRSLGDGLDKNGVNCQSEEPRKASEETNATNQLTIKAKETKESTQTIEVSESSDLTAIFKKRLTFYENISRDNKQGALKTDSPTINQKNQSQNQWSVFSDSSNTSLQDVESKDFKQMKEPVLKTIEANDLSSCPRDKVQEAKIRQLNNAESTTPMTVSSENEPPQLPQRHNNWSNNDLIIEYTSEPRALVPSKRTTSSMPAFPNPYNNATTNYQLLNRSDSQQRRTNLPPTQAQSQQFVAIPLHQSMPSQQPPPQQLRPTIPATYQQRIPYPHQPSPVAQSLGSPTNQKPLQYAVAYHNNFQQPHLIRMAHSMPQNYPVNQLRPTHSPQMQFFAPRLHPPPYHYHLQQQQLQLQNQQSHDFPNASEIRRRDGLNAYPHVLDHPPQPGVLPVPSVLSAANAAQSAQSKDELEQFVEQDIERTERIKKRYSLSEDDDPSFGFARRPSVRGIRPRYGSTTEILKQMQSQMGSSQMQMTGNHISWSAASNSHLQAQQQQQPTPQQQKQPQLVQIRVAHQQHPQMVKHVTGPAVAGQFQSRTLPRPSSLITPPTFKAINSDDNFVGVITNNEVKLQQEMEQHLQQKLQIQQKYKTMSSTSLSMTSNSLSMSSLPTSAKPVVNKEPKDERGAPEGASSSPKHSFDLLFARTGSEARTDDGQSTADGQPLGNGQATNRESVETKPDNTKPHLVNNNSKSNVCSKVTADHNSGVIFYSMNV